MSSLWSNIEERKPLVTRLLQRQMQSLGVSAAVDWMQFEVASSGLPGCIDRKKHTLKL